MIELGSGKYNVAWFKLAEFISRRERERALGIYRLLAHSLSDEGLALQLEGDIYLSFNDTKKATESYLKATESYQNNEKFIEVAAVYEHLMTIEPKSIDFALKAYNIYILINNQNKIQKSLEVLIDLVIFNEKISEFGSIVEKEDFSLGKKILLFESFIYRVLAQNKSYLHYLYTYTEQVIDYCLKFNREKLNLFFDKLEKLNFKMYSHAVSYLDKLEIK